MLATEEIHCILACYAIQIGWRSSIAINSQREPSESMVRLFDHISSLKEPLLRNLCHVMNNYDYVVQRVTI